MVAGNLKNPFSFILAWLAFLIPVLWTKFRRSSDELVLLAPNMATNATRCKIFLVQDVVRHAVIRHDVNGPNCRRSSFTFNDVVTSSTRTGRGRRLSRRQPVLPQPKWSPSSHFVVWVITVWSDWAIYWILGNFSKSVASIILPKLPTFLGNFCKGVKNFNFSREIIFGQLL